MVTFVEINGIKYCCGPIENVFLCSKCGKPIEYDKKMVDVDFNYRTQMSNLVSAGDGLFHLKCAREVFGKYLTSKSEYKDLSEVV